MDNITRDTPSRRANAVTVTPADNTASFSTSPGVDGLNNAWQNQF